LLTADLVHVRRRGERLTVVPLAEADRPRARELATAALALIRAHVGLPRGALLEAWSQIAISRPESRLAQGLWKLALDACAFEAGDELDLPGLRRDLFSRAAAARASGRDFDRDAVLAEAAQARGMTPETVEEALYADLPSAHLLRVAQLPSPDGLLAQYELACQQAVLLRAVHVRARVFCAQPGGYRRLFRQLKFRRLLYSVAALGQGQGYALDLDGPMSLFEQTTKYGLGLALALPSLMECDAWQLDAELRWGKDRRPLRYHLRGAARTTLAEAGARLPDDVAGLVAALRGQESPWQASPAEAILRLPGVGVCVPDLEFVHRESGQRVYLEVLGFWSRAAVWKRIELAEAGLPCPVVFAVSKHLRVSEDALPAEVPAALYVYARTLNAHAVLERVAAVAGRTGRNRETEG
jgi:predicted nuclease of restriction endonuclease-like RecB superfamily